MSKLQLIFQVSLSFPLYCQFVVDCVALGAYSRTRHTSASLVAVLNLFRLGFQLTELPKYGYVMILTENNAQVGKGKKRTISALLFDAETEMIGGRQTWVVRITYAITHPEYQKQGFMRLLVTQLKAMRGETGTNRRSRAHMLSVN